MSQGNEVAIDVKNLYKNFNLPHEKVTSVKNIFTNPFQQKKSSNEVQHVLKDISFTINKGEFFGIVGRNGSGKSTLLKIIAEIYRPTKGHVKINGRLVPFIELGVGFNPELTGRENVYLNGALMGFSDKQIDEMYDEIVEFAELEKFMDQKFKNYSSGMQVRLAFSIAIRAESDILLLDEVLAVGDESFQKKCNNYFETIKKDKTKTIILVTHNMEAVKRFCDRAMLIGRGEIVTIGSPEDVANKYTEENFSVAQSEQKSGKYQLGLSSQIPLLTVRAKSKQILRAGEDMEFEVEYEITDDTPVHVAISIKDETRNCVVMANRSNAITGKGAHKLTYRFPTAIYNDSDFSVSAVVDEKETLNRVAFTNENGLCRFSIRNEYSFGSLLAPFGEIHGGWVGDIGEYLIDRNGKEVR